MTDREQFEAWWSAYADTGYVKRVEPIAWSAWQAATDAALSAPAQPAWHDAPTVPGAWICADKEHVKRTHTITPGILPVISKFGDRWYGPIPEDKP